MTMPGFDPEFASAAEWARLYRFCSIQVVPAFMPGEAKGASWKRPLLKNWKQYQDELVSDEVFDPWYGPLGQYRQRPNMGVICGRASSNLMVIDLDVYKKPDALRWWLNLLELHNARLELETVEQRTGGGGLQKLFHCPPGWAPPTCKTPIGIDIRGQGGFAMLCPSMHESGKAYEWLEGRSPDDIEILMAPGWLLEAVEALVVEHGGSGPASHETRKPGANGQGEAFDGFGHQTDLREQKMTELVWGVLVDMKRARPMMAVPSDRELRLIAAEKYLVYESLVSPRVFDPARTKTEMLELEDRGPSMFWRKIQYAMKQWAGKIDEEARKPAPNKDKTGTGQGGAGFNPGFTDFTDEYAARPRVDPATGQPLPLILTDLEFTKDFRPPDYLVDGVVQKGYLYSLTGPTGHGKTPVSMLLGSRVSRGLEFHGKPVSQGGVLFLAGENADDIRARYIAMADHEGFAIGSVPFHFIDGVIDISAEMGRIEAEAARIRDLSLVIIDTDQAYFLGDEGNSNEQRKWFAKILRRLLRLPGNPAALVNCHPTKNATQDNLVPIGGSSFLNEVDGNITCWTEDRTCTVKPHASKWRGVAFEALSFELRTITCDRLRDTRGRHIPSVMAFPITEEGAQRRAAVAEEDEKIVLRLLHAERDASFATVARNASWFWPDGQPSKSRVQKICDRLYKSKILYRLHNGKYRLTRSGCRLIGVKWEDYDDE